MTTFRLGRLLATPGALEALTPDTLLDVLQRHAGGNWGELCDDDRAANEAALLPEEGRWLLVRVSGDRARLHRYDDDHAFLAVRDVDPLGLIPYEEN